ncbi:MAG TPA: methyl-accepting chemotaxis protein [Burkholderiaceae bacterium]|nr:methyl-accepting chemotaxis protein [Burkholderiaceae bacterium]HMX09790.1 methyl-accepting chemotaxis protein [Burkholderiaceae bacterium]HNG78178.1 methyl-accepting chemotaxis protein [Burkholderiaceae bacterium]
MKSLSISKRLWLPNLIVAAVILVLAIAIGLRTRQQVEAAQTAQLAQLQTIEAATQWAGLTEANATRALAAVMSADAQLSSKLKGDMDDTSAQISELQKAIEARITQPEERAALDRVGQARKAYVDLRKQVLTQRGDAAVPEDQVQALRARLNSYVKTQRDFVALQHARATQQSMAAAEQRMATVYLVIGVMLLLCAMLLASTAMSVRAIIAPLRAARNATDRIAGGDLSGQIDSDRDDEIGELMHGLDRMTASLRQLVTEVRSGAASMQIASSEIASGNADLSTRTEQTAGSLQATAGSMSQLTVTVQQSADSAAQANQLASSAADTAARGGEVVSQVVTNMEEIAASSRKIGDIIGVIDGIAFQTNILALNAAVEAARAGEQGRGFAVVAGEVRALAQRSAGAAREIKSLIGASMDTVEQGSKLVQDAGVTMTDLVASVRRVTDIIGEISASAREQNEGIRQVNHAVTRLDEMTQQNAALVEESAAAADSMREQAQRLNQLVLKFEVGTHDGLGSPASTHTPALGHAMHTTHTAHTAHKAAKPHSAHVKTPAAAKPAAAAPKPATAPAASAAASAAAMPPAPAPAMPAAVASAAVGDDWETF